MPDTSDDEGEDKPADEGEDKPATITWLHLYMFVLCIGPLLIGYAVARWFTDPSIALKNQVVFKTVIATLVALIALLYNIGYEQLQIHVGSSVRMTTSAALVKKSFDDHGYAWDDQMYGMLGQTFPVLALPGPSHVGLPSPDHGQNGWWFFHHSVVKRAHFGPPLPYEDFFVAALKYCRFVVPLSALVISMSVWMAPEQDLHCGPGSWGPMIPAIGDLYLPSPQSSADNASIDWLLDVSVIVPRVPSPQLLLPHMNHQIIPSDKHQRLLYFPGEMFLLCVVTCAVLELSRLLTGGRKKQKSNGDLTTPLAPRPEDLEGSLSDMISQQMSQRSLERSHWYNGLFSIYYVGYQIFLYVLMDFAVSHGLLNLTTGIAWELWLPFIEMILVTQVFTGLVRYICSGDVLHKHPTQLVAMQLMPWLGNELHIMKDHIAGALCFAAAHCAHGQLRKAGLVLGACSIVATFIPLPILLTNEKAFAGLRMAHWPIAEALPVPRSTIKKTRREQLQRFLVETTASATTHEKYLRAMACELPHGCLHILFAFFFGGGLFITTAIAMSVAKVLVIPVGRAGLRHWMVDWGCSEATLANFLANGSGPLVYPADDSDNCFAIKVALKKGWLDVVNILQSLLPDTNFDELSDTDALSRAADIGGADRFADVLRVFHEELGVDFKNYMFFIVLGVLANKFPQECLHLMPEVIKMGADTEAYYNQETIVQFTAGLTDENTPHNKAIRSALEECLPGCYEQWAAELSEKERRVKEGLQRGPDQALPEAVSAVSGVLCRCPFRWSSCRFSRKQATS